MLFVYLYNFDFPLTPKNLLLSKKDINVVSARTMFTRMECFQLYDSFLSIFVYSNINYINSSEYYENSFKYLNFIVNVCPTHIL